MVLCKYYIDSLECPVFKKCPDEHLDIRHFMKSEMECAVRGQQWLLSCFGPYTERPCIPNYIEDLSFEEVRLMYYDPKKQSFFDSCQQFAKAIEIAKSKMKTLAVLDNDVMDVLADLYNTPPKENKQPPRNPFESFANNTVFGGNSGGSVFQFGNTSSGGGFFGGPAQKSVFEQNSFGFGATQPQNFGFFSPPQPSQSVGLFGPQQQQADAPSPAAPNTSSQNQSCSECKDYLKEILGILRFVLTVGTDNKDLLKKQQEQIDSLSNSLQHSSLNDEENAKKPSKKEEPSTKQSIGNVSPLAVTPKCKQSSAKTKSDIKDSIDPLELSIQINSISKSSNGSILIKCNNEESVKKLENEINTKFGDLYQAKVIKLVSPRIMVNGIDNDLDEDNLIRTIKKQNKINGDMKLIRCFEKGNNGYKYNAIIEVDKALHKSLMDRNEPFFNIGWNKCHVFDNLNVKRCFNCWGFNHNARNCRSETRCPKCGGDHSDIDCKSRRLKCMNCTKANVRLNSKLDVGHDSRNRNCHIYLKMLQREREMIDY